MPTSVEAEGAVCWFAVNERALDIDRLGVGYARLTCSDLYAGDRPQMSFLSGVEAPLKSYAVRIRLDRRDVFWSDAVRDCGKTWHEDADFRRWLAIGRHTSGILLLRRLADFVATIPEHGYPVLAGESADERVLGVYLSGFSVDF